MLDPLDPLVSKLTNYMILCGFRCVGNLAGSFDCCCSHRPTGHHQACHEQTVVIIMYTSMQLRIRGCPSQSGHVRHSAQLSTDRTALPQHGIYTSEGKNMEDRDCFHGLNKLAQQSPIMT